MSLTPEKLLFILFYNLNASFLCVCVFFNLRVCDYKYEFIKAHIEVYMGGGEGCCPANDDNDGISFLLLL